MQTEPQIPSPSAVLRDVTLTLAGLYSSYAASPELVDATAAALREVWHQSRSSRPRAHSARTTPLQALAEELDRELSA